jgi:glutamine phosphoribosylpyrophosphate amidotransferase
MQLIRDANTSKVVGHFGVGKIVSNLERYVYWSRMHEDVAKILEYVYFVAPSSPIIGSKVYTIPYLYPLNLGKAFPWMLLEFYQPLGRGMTIYLW